MGHMEHGCYILHSRIRLVKSHFYGLSFQVPVRLCGRRLTGGTGVSWLQPGDKFSHSAAFFQQQRAEQLAAPKPPCLCRNACGREKNVLHPCPIKQPHGNTGTAADPARQVRPPSDAASVTSIYPEWGPGLLTWRDAEHF